MALEAARSALLIHGSTDNNAGDVARGSWWKKS